MPACCCKRRTKGALLLQLDAVSSHHLLLLLLPPICILAARWHGVERGRGCSSSGAATAAARPLCCLWRHLCGLWQHANVACTRRKGASLLLHRHAGHVTANSLCVCRRRAARRRCWLGSRRVLLLLVARQALSARQLQPPQRPRHKLRRQQRLRQQWRVARLLRLQVVLQRRSVRSVIASQLLSRGGRAPLDATLGDDARVSEGGVWRVGKQLEGLVGGVNSSIEHRCCSSSLPTRVPAISTILLPYLAALPQTSGVTIAKQHSVGSTAFRWSTSRSTSSPARSPYHVARSASSGAACA